METQTRLRNLPRICWVALMLAFHPVAGIGLPYDPTSIFYAEHGSSQVVYIVEPPSSDAPHGRLRSLGATSSMSTNSALSATVLSQALPFLTNSSSPYTSILSSDGSIAVYVGNCSAGPKAASVWTYKLDATSSNGAGRWTQQNLSVIGGTTTTAPLPGPAYLAGGVSFAVDGKTEDASLYMFGGMCPDSNSTPQTWTSAATYTNQMFALQPVRSAGYDFAVSSSQGAPIAEAGFTMTPLTPSFSNTTSGIIAQQQSFLLLGGHTRDAFINMSQVALFSLPQAGWTFFPIAQPSGRTDLTRRDDVGIVEPRSGHSAVLTADGSKIIVFGGWVGDVSNIAEPQLAILDLGQGFGGSSDWAWSVPASINLPTSSGQGFYGHGATLLPGNIMMITGGYRISNSSANSDSSQTPNTQTMFYNASSNTWLQSYNPNLVLPSAQTQTSGGALSTSSQKTGFGVGLAVGLLVLGFILLFVFIYWQRKKDRRSDSPVSDHGDSHSGEIDDLWQTSLGNQGHQYPPYLGSEQPAWDRRGFYGTQTSWNEVREAERTGYEVDVPSPNRGLRKGKPPYQQVPKHDDRSFSFTGVPMQPIEEGDETSSIESKSKKKKQPEMKEVNNPFRDPVLTNQSSRSVSASALGQAITQNTVAHSEGWGRELERRRREWSDAKTSHAEQAQSGRVSPDKSERTTSSLSDNSSISGLSAQSAKGFARKPLPQALPADPFVTPEGSPTRDAAPLDIFRTPPSSRGHDRQAGENDELRRLSGDKLAPDLEPTFTRAHPLRHHSRLGGWVGSMRRAVLPAVNTSGRTVSMTSATLSPLGGFVEIPDSAAIRPGEPSSSSSSSPTKQKTSESEMMRTGPRRAVSESGSKWTSRLHARDLSSQPHALTSQQPAPAPPPHQWRRAHNAPPSASSGSKTKQIESQPRRDSDEDWIEQTVRDREVQVMFTVPRERLRVVNGEAGSISDVGDD